MTLRCVMFSGLGAVKDPVNTAAARVHPNDEWESWNVSTGTECSPMEIRQLALDDLILDPNLNLRDQLDQETVQRYAESFAVLPPVTVFDVEGRLLLADGFHRHGAAMVLDRASIPAVVRPGSYHDALEYAAGANFSHGLPLTRLERRRAIEIKLRLHTDWSDRRLAEDMGVSRDSVAKIRKQLADAGQIPHTTQRVGADGKAYPAQGLPRDPNEHLPTGPAVAQQSDPRDRSGGKITAVPWDDTKDPLPPVTEEPAIAIAAAPAPAPAAESRDAALNSGPSGKKSAPAANAPARNAAPSAETNGNGNASASASVSSAPWEDAGAATARSSSGTQTVVVDSPTELVEMVARQIGEIAGWTEADEFLNAFLLASHEARSLYLKAVKTMSQRAKELTARAKTSEN